MSRQTDAAESPIRAAREALGLSREGLAFKTGLTLRTVERIEAGEIQLPHRLTRQAIARVLGCDPADLGWPQEAAA